MIASAALARSRGGLRRATPLANLILLLAFVVAVLGSPGIFVKLGALLLVVFLSALSGGAPAEVLRRGRFVIGFSVFLWLVQVLSVRDGSVLFSFGVPVTDRGLLLGVEMAMRFLVIVLSSLLFVAVTDADRLARAILSLGIPYRYTFTFVLALRFVPFFREEYRTVREAQRVRGIDRSIRSLKSLRRSIRYTVLPVLVAGLARVDTVAVSMKGRGFDLHAKRTITRRERWHPIDLAVVGLSLLLVAATILARERGWQ